MLTRRSILAAAGLILPAAPFIARANLLQKPITAGGGGGGAYALVAHAVAQNPGAVTTTAATPINTTGATLLVVNVACFNDTLTLVVSDNKGNTFTLAKDSPPSYETFPESDTLWYCRGGTVGSGHTFTVTNESGGGGTTLAAAAFSGGNVSPLDQSNQFSSIATSQQAGSITPTTTNQLVVAGVCATVGNSFSIDSGFSVTDVADSVGSTIFGGGMAYLIQTSIVAANPTWSWTTLSDSFAVIASFK